MSHGVVQANKCENVSVKKKKSIANLYCNIKT